MWFAFAPRGYMSFTTLPAFYYNHLRALNYNNKSRFYILFCFFFRRVQNQVHGQSKPAYICHGLLVAASPIPSAALYLFLFLADFSPPDLVSSNQNRHVTPHWNLVLNCEMLFMRASLRAQRENLLLHPAPFAIRSHACRVPCAPTNKFPPVFGFLVLFFSIFVFCSAVFFIRVLLHAIHVQAPQRIGILRKVNFSDCFDYVSRAMTKTGRRKKTFVSSVICWYFRFICRRWESFAFRFFNPFYPHDASNPRIFT